MLKTVFHQWYMINFSQIFCIIVFGIILSNSSYASENNIKMHDLIHEKINIHFLDPMHLTREDYQDIHDHIEFYHLYNYEHKDKLKKDQYLGYKIQNPMEHIDSRDVINNKEKIGQLKKTRINTLQKSLLKSKNKKFSENLDFIPLHFEAPISSK